jgi:hypothetical protein
MVDYKVMRDSHNPREKFSVIKIYLQQEPDPEYKEIYRQKLYSYGGGLVVQSTAALLL